MTTHALTCEQFADRLADYLEHDLDEPTRGALEAHAAACASCGTLLADVRELRVAAAALPPLHPDHDLWSGIAERIAAPVVPLDRRDGAPTRRPGRFAAPGTRWALMSAAAVALIVVSVGTTYVTMRGRSGGQPLRQVASVTEPVKAPFPAVSASPTPPQQGAGASPASSVSRVDSPATGTPAAPTTGRPAVRLASNTGQKPSAEDTYGREIAMLKAIVAQRRSTLDTATIAVIEKNLAVIDSAVAQCRAALAKDPASGFLLQSLNSALEAKVELLRTAATLPAHT